MLSMGVRRRWSRQVFEELYRDGAPWDIGRPQPVFLELADSGRVRGSVLDVGCGSGENALLFASRGHETLGIDHVPAAIELARHKARQRALAATFEVGDALMLGDLRARFDNVIDSGLLHVLGGAEKRALEAGLRRVLRPGGGYFLLCFCDREPGDHGPERISEARLRGLFASDWEIVELRQVRSQVTAEKSVHFTPGGPRAWFAEIRRPVAGRPSP